MWSYMSTLITITSPPLCVIVFADAGERPQLCSGSQVYSQLAVRLLGNAMGASLECDCWGIGGIEGEL